jgi:hypothetical protein
MALPALTLVAQQLLDNKTWVLPSFDLFTTDFSDSEIAQRGSAIVIGGLTPNSASKFSSTSNFTGVAAAGFSGLATVDIMYSTRSYTQAQWNALQNTAFLNAAQTVVSECASGVVNEATALINSTNFSTNAYSGSTWSYDSLVTSGLVAVPSATAALVKVTPFVKLAADIKAYSTFGDSSVMQNLGKQIKVGGVNFCEATALPTGNGAGASLDGAIFKKSAIGIATRLTFPVGNDGFAEVVNVTDPDTNLTIQLRQWKNYDLGLIYVGAFCSYATAFGGGSNQGALYIH